MNLLSPPLLPVAVSRKACLIAAALALPFSVAQAATLWSTDFTAPPYTLNQTVIDKQGWVSSQFDSDDTADAAVIAYSGATGGTALRLYSTSTNPATLRQRSRIYNNFEKVDGPKVQATFSMAYDWKGSSVNGSSVYFNTSAESSPLTIYFNAKDGLYLRGTYGTETDRLILSAADAAKNSFYNFTVIFDFEARTFDLTITGFDAKGDAITIPINGFTFQSGTTASMNGISTVRLFNDRGDNIMHYVDQITIASIPEGSTLGMLGGAGALVVIGSLFRRRATR